MVCICAAVFLNVIHVLRSYPWDELENEKKKGSQGYTECTITRAQSKIIFGQNFWLKSIEADIFSTKKRKKKKEREIKRKKRKYPSPHKKNKTNKQ